jgi:hypothetical protein
LDERRVVQTRGDHRGRKARNRREANPAHPDILSATGSCYQNGVRFLFLPALPALAASVFAIAVGCTDTSADIDVTGPQPQIIAAVGPANGVVACNDPVVTTDAGTLVDAGENLGGNCPISVKLTFHLPPGQFVNKALIRFQGDGSSDGIDRGFTLPQTFGQGTTDVSVTVDAAVPTDILRRGALYTYEVRLISGAGAVSLPTTLTVSVT